MLTIDVDTIAEGHEKVVRAIMTGDFNDVTTEDKELTFEYPEPVNIHIRNPEKSPQASSALRFGEYSLGEYANQVLTPKPLVDKPGSPAFSYLYSNLIFDFPNGEPYKVWREKDQDGKEQRITTSLESNYTGGHAKFMRVDWMVGNGRGDGTNQINYVVKKLSDKPESRRAVVSLFEPEGHPAMDDPPCLNHIQFMIRNGHLNCHALFRSNDMLSAWGGNAYALSNLQRHVLDLVNRRITTNTTPFEMGWLETTSISAHIYWKRDVKELEEFKRLWR